MTKKDGAEKKTLDDYGIIFISGELYEGTAQSVCEKIIEMNLNQDSDFIQLIINSEGGLCSVRFAIVDMMDWSRLPVYTTGVGIVASMALQ